MTVTIHELADYVHAFDGEYPDDHTRNGSWYIDVRLPMLGGCSGCGATIAAYNSYPAIDGYLRCADCIGDDGWEFVAMAYSDLMTGTNYAADRAEERRKARYWARCEEGYNNFLRLIESCWADKLGYPRYDSSIATMVVKFLWNDPAAFANVKAGT